MSGIANDAELFITVMFNAYVYALNLMADACKERNN